MEKIAAKEVKSSKFLYFSVFSINLVCLTAGTAFAWSSSALPKLTSLDPSVNPLPGPITQNEESLIASLIAIGAIFGTFFAGHACDSIGRKRSLLIFALPLYLSFVVIAFANRVWLFYVARALVGFSVGGFFVIMPTYVAEISEKGNRGLLSCLLAVNITTGNLLIYTIGPYLPLHVSSLICLVPASAFFVLVGCFVPESPYFLLMKRDAGAEAALVKFRGSSEVKNELLELTEAIEQAVSSESGICEFFKNASLVKRLLITFGLVTFQQMCGINAILFYLQSIFVAAGSTLPPELSAIVIAAVQCGSSIVTPLLVDRLGRKLLLYISGTGTLVALCLLGAFFHGLAPLAWLPILSLIVYILTYSLGFGPIPFTILGEIFPTNAKSLAATLTVCLCFVFTFLTTVFFPYLIELIGTAKSFWLFAAFSAVSLTFTRFCVPETKGKTLIEIDRMMSDKN